MPEGYTICDSALVGRFVRRTSGLVCEVLRADYAHRGWFRLHFKCGGSVKHHHERLNRFSRDTAPTCLGCLVL